MNKADKICILLVVVCSLFLYVPLYWIRMQEVDKAKEVVVSFKNEEVLRVPLNKDQTYYVSGTLGDVAVEVKNDAVRVEKETSPMHLCSIQGWVEQSNHPIVCLPNNIVVSIEASDGDEEVDTVIQ